MSENTHHAAIPRVRDWEPIRKAYVTEAERPEFAELADRFSLPINTVIKASSQEGWAILRARYAESQLALSGAVGSLMAAAKGESLLIERFRSLTIVLLEQLEADAQALKQLSKPSQHGRRIDLAQKITFAAKNLADTMKSLGITGLPKALRESLDKAGADTGDGYAKGLSAALTQLNLSVTVNSGDQSQKPVEIVQDKPV